MSIEIKNYHYLAKNSEMLFAETRGTFYFRFPLKAEKEEGMPTRSHPLLLFC